MRRRRGVGGMVFVRRIVEFTVNYDSEVMSGLAVLLFFLKGRYGIIVRVFYRRNV